MISFLNGFNETFIYLDNEGIDDMIHYLEYLKNHSDVSYHLSLYSELNESEEMGIEEKPEESQQVTHVKIINLDNLI